MKTVSWFSAGVSSAVATKMSIQHIDEIYYIHIQDQHQDTLRFVNDCEKWFNKQIQIIYPQYVNVENACRMSGGRGYINGPAGAACTKFLKRRVRKEWESQQDTHLRYVWGMDVRETKRSDNLLESMPEQDHLFPLIDSSITKKDAHKILYASGIKRPEMYDLGYQNNNCKGCVKGGMGYWNKIRRDFPDVFASRARMERDIRATCIKGVYLDELDPDRGRHDEPIVDECGVMCELLVIGEP